MIHKLVHFQIGRMSTRSQDSANLRADYQDKEREGYTYLVSEENCDIAGYGMIGAHTGEGRAQIQSNESRFRRG